MNSEILKKVAETLGYRITENCNNEWAVTKGDGSGCWSFDLSKSEIILEAFDYYKITISPFGNNEYSACIRYPELIIETGLTRVEAVETALTELYKPT